MNQDFQDMLAALRTSAARFLVVGAHALAIHGMPRVTGDRGPVPRETLIRNKRATGRLQDLADVERLEEEKG